MTTTNTCKKCGCQDSFMPSPAPCPTPVGCPTPEPCSEVLDAQCVIYTGATITCDTDVIVTTNDTVAEALESITDYFCNNSTPCICEYKYINSLYAAGEAFITNTDWYVDTTYNSFNYTASYTGKYKITLTVNCYDEDPGSNGLIGFGINGADPIGNASTNPFVIKNFRGLGSDVQTHTYIIDLVLGDIVQLMFKRISLVMALDGAYMTIEKVAN